MPPKKRKAAPVPEEQAADAEMADIDRILEERKTKAGKTQYLCSWMDGEEPQWLDAVHLEGTVALEEWEEAEPEVPEVRDPPEVVAAKVATLVGWFKDAKRPAWLVGAGLSAAVLPTFRGKGGLWTRGAGPVVKKAKLGKAAAAAAAPPRPEPTLAHRALVTLEKAGFVNFVASQNYDDLFTAAGFPDAKLAELHGNIFKEACAACGHVYHRDFEVELSSAKDHETGRFCEQKGCGGALRDQLIHFGEALPFREVSMANAKFVGADLTLALGTSLRVEMAASLPFKAKLRTRKPAPGDAAAPIRCRAVIVNLQPTPKDKYADLIIHATCDDVLQRLLAALAPGAE